MNRLPRKERINHNNRFFIDPEKEKERERSQVSTSSAKIFINPRIEKSGGGAVAGSKRRRRSHGIIPWNENILVGSRILPTLRFINIPNDLYDPLYSTLSPSIHRLDPRRIPLSVFFLRFVLFSHRGKEVGRLFSRWISSANTDSRFQGGATRSRWRWLRRSDSRDICIRGQARLTLSLDPFLYFSCYFWQRERKTLTRLFRF